MISDIRKKIRDEIKELYGNDTRFRDMRIVVSNVRRIMKEQNISSDHLAEMMKSSKSFVNKLINGNHYPSIKMVHTLAEIFKVDIEVLYKPYNRDNCK